MYPLRKHISPAIHAGKLGEKETVKQISWWGNGTIFRKKYGSDTVTPTQCPGIFIPCETLEALKELISELYTKGILTDESWEAVNVPKDFLEMMNDPSYFDTAEVCGFIYRKRAVKDFEKRMDDLL